MTPKYLSPKRKALNAFYYSAIVAAFLGVATAKAFNVIPSDMSKTTARQESLVNKVEALPDTLSYEPYTHQYSLTAHPSSKLEDLAYRN